MVYIANEVTRLDGHKAETILHKCNETRKIMFLQDFQSRCATELVFDTAENACKYLDKHYAPSIHLITDDEIWSQSPMGEKQLCYFGKLVVN